LIERPKGATDVPTEELVRLERMASALDGLAESFGYRPVDVPVLEQTDLYLRKSGAEMAARLYSLTDQGGRRLSLRPEFTASVVRTFIESGDTAALPVRLFYRGPVFRQRGRYRQFTQHGVELLGSDSPRADAEVIALAWRAATTAGLRDVRLVIGHVGTVHQLLEHLRLSERLKSHLIGSLENLGRKNRGLDFVRRRLAEIGVVEAAPDGGIEAVLEGLGEREVRQIVQALLTTMNIELTASREPEEIVERLLRKMQGKEEAAVVERALEFIDRLASIEGAPGPALAEARALVRTYGLSEGALDALDQILSLLGAYAIPSERIVVDFGLARGLAYYSGTVFEVLSDRLAADRALGGGGRYDGLVRALGGRADVPALGYALTLQRLRDAQRAEWETETGEPAREAPGPDVYVFGGEGADFGQAIRMADRLRAEGHRVELDARDRPARANLEYAHRRGMPAVVSARGRSEFGVRSSEFGVPPGPAGEDARGAGEGRATGGAPSPQPSPRGRGGLAPGPAPTGRDAGPTGEGVVWVWRDMGTGEERVVTPGAAE
jgi:histidyl-tRNA synthetase